RRLRWRWIRRPWRSRWWRRRRRSAAAASNRQRRRREQRIGSGGRGSGGTAGCGQPRRTADQLRAGERAARLSAGVRHGSVRADAEGKLWIRVIPTKPLTGGPEYDVIDRSGKLVD